MASIELLDKRLLERKIRLGEASAAEVEEAAQGLPDLADNLAAPDEAALERLGEELVSEQILRSDRIERALSGEPAEVAEPVRIIPVESVE